VGPAKREGEGRSFTRTTNDGSVYPRTLDRRGRSVGRGGCRYPFQTILGWGWRNATVLADAELAGPVTEE